MKKKLIPLYTSQKSQMMGDLFTAEPIKTRASDLLGFAIRVPHNENQDIEIEFFEKAFNYVLKKNDALRIQLQYTKKGIMQYVKEYKPVSITHKYLNGKAEYERYLEDLDKMWLKWTSETFVWAQFVHWSDDDCELIIKVHHFFFDGYSISLFTQEFQEAYFILKQNEELDESKYPSVLDVYINKQAYVKSDRYQRDKAYWKDKYNHQRNFRYPAGRRALSGASDEVNLEIKKDDFDQLLLLSKTLKCSLESLLMTLISLEVYMLSGKDNFSIQTLTHGRINYKEKQTMGSLQNIIPVFYDINGDQSVIQFLKESYMNYLQALSHEGLLYEDHIKYSYKEAVRNGFNFYHEWLLFSSLKFLPVDGKGALEIRILPKTFSATQFYLALLQSSSGSVQLKLIYQKKKYSRETCEYYLSLFEKIYKKAISNPEMSIKDFCDGMSL